MHAWTLPTATWWVGQGTKGAVLCAGAAVGGIHVPGPVFFSHQGKVVQGLASWGTHLFVAVSLGVLCDMWHVSESCGRHSTSWLPGWSGPPLGGAQPGAGRRKWVVGALGFLYLVTCFQRVGSCFSFCREQGTPWGDSDVLLWALGLEDAAEDPFSPLGGALLGWNLGGHQFLSSGLTSVPKAFDVRWNRSPPWRSCLFITVMSRNS